MTRTASTTPTAARRRAAGGPAKKAEAPAVEPEPIETDPEDEPEGVTEGGRLWASFAFKDRSVKLLEPTDGQKFVLVQTIGITDESADDQEKMELALGFAAMVRALFLKPVERQFVTGALARGTAEIEDYFSLAREMAEYWDVESAPPATNREDRRARERKPVARASVRPRR
jgi:hypothetical protein